MTRRIFIWTGIFTILSLAPFGIAGQGRLQFVETDVILFPNGRASIEYVVRYTVLSGEFHGFYFGGLDRLTPIFDINNASAIDSRGNTYGLDIKKISSDKYDIVLANGIGISSGYVTYRFRFASDMSKAGYLVPTTTDEGRKLVVFDWSPTEWDQPLEHYTVKVVYPIQYPSSQTDRSSIAAALLARGFATERFMNQEYKIDYRLRKVGGEQHIEVLLHKERARTKYHFRIQQYIDGDVFQAISSMAPRRSSQPRPPKLSLGRGILAKVKKISSRWSLGIGLIITLLTGIFGVSRKHRSMVRAQSELDMVKWVREDWEPPKIELASFRKKGKIAKDLDPIEAGMFVGVPYKQIFSTILSQLVKRNCIVVINRDPLQVEVVRPLPISYSELGPYEQRMLQAAKDDGKFSEQELNDLLKKVVHNIQQKAWDCDIEATKNYYHDEIARAFDKVSQELLSEKDRKDDPVSS